MARRLGFPTRWLTRRADAQRQGLGPPPIFGTASFTGDGSVSAVGERSAWVPVFVEDFAGAALDSSKWVTGFWWVPVGATGSSGNEEGLFTPAPANVSVSGGSLHLTARDEDATGWNGVPFHYTTGMVSTGGANSAPGFAFTKGKAEARVWIPAGAGLWPRFQLLPVSHTMPPAVATEVYGAAPDTVRMRYDHGTSGATGYATLGGVGAFAVPTRIPRLTATRGLSGVGSLSGSGTQGGGGGGLIEPTASNTGPRQTPLTTVGATTISVDGTTWSRVQVNGELRIEANNVTLTDCKIVGNVALSKGQGIGNYPPKSNIKLSYCEMATVDSLGVDLLTLEYCKILGVPNGTIVMLQSYANGSSQAMITNTTLLSNYWQQPPPYVTDPNGAHRECIFLFGAVHTILMRGNSFNFIGESLASATLITGCIMSQGRTVDGNNQFVNGWTCDNNWVYGGGFYQAYFDQHGTSSCTNNKFHSYPRYPGGGTVSSPVIPPSQGGYGGTYVPMSPATGNTLDGAPYSIPNP